MNDPIVHVITTIDLGGAEKQLLTLASRQVEQGNSVHVIFLKDTPTLNDEFLSAGVHVNSEFSGKSFLRQILALRKYRRLGISIYHAHLPRAEFLCALALKSKSFIVTRHNSENFFPGNHKWASRTLSRFTLRRAFAVIAISKAVTDFLSISKELPPSIPCHLIYYGLKEKSDLSVRKSKFDSRPYRLGIVARLVPQKNLYLLLDTLKKLNELEKNCWMLEIVGVGPLQRELQKYSKTLGVENLVRWRGHLRELSHFYSTLDAFILTSDYEGFGLVLLEAMAYEIPVVARNISAIPEVLGDEHPGLTVTNDSIGLSSKLIEVSTNREMVENYLRFQANRVALFSINRTEVGHTILYSQMLSVQRRLQ